MNPSEWKICFVVPSLSSGGAERVVSVLASELANQGCQVHVIKYFEADNEYPISEKLKVTCLSGGDENTYKRIRFKEKIATLRKLVKNIEPDYIIPFLPHVAVHVALACACMRIKMVQTIRNAPNIAPAPRMQRWIRNALVVCSYKTFAQTSEQKDYFPKIIHKKIFVLPNPIYEGFLNEDRSVHHKIGKIVSVGRLAEQKNFPLVIDAVAELKTRYTDLELNVYGEGELKEELEKYIQNKGASEYCHLCGRSDALLMVYRDSDVFVLPSNFEGMPNALMEALATGIPCISTDCETGPRDLIQSGKSGFLIPVNSREKLVESLEWIINNPEEAHKMGQRAKFTTIQKFSARTISESLLMNLSSKR